MKAVYVTFTICTVFRFMEDKKYAVCCNNMDDAREVAQDACSLIATSNVRIRKCGKPRNRIIIDCNEYWRDIA